MLLLKGYSLHALKNFVQHSSKQSNELNINILILQICKLRHRGCISQDGDKQLVQSHQLFESTLKLRQSSAIVSCCNVYSTLHLYSVVQRQSLGSHGFELIETLHCLHQFSSPDSLSNMTFIFLWCSHIESVTSHPNMSGVFEPLCHLPFPSMSPTPITALLLPFFQWKSPIYFLNQMLFPLYI